MNHCGNGNPDICPLKMVDRLQGLLESAFPPEGFVPLFHAIQAHLNLVHTKSFCYLSVNQCAVGKEDRSK